MGLDTISKAIIKFLYTAHIENKTPKSVMDGNGGVYTQYPAMGSDYKNEIEIMFHLIKLKHGNIIDLKFILQNLISEGLIECNENNPSERRYRLTAKGYAVNKSINKYSIRKISKVVFGLVTLLAAVLTAIWYAVDLYKGFMK